MGAKYDFSGWATKNDIRCSDGRIIRHDAFKDCDGMTVPLVWNHQHNSPDNVLGHAVLENRDDGVYAYCSFNNTDTGNAAREFVRHGDVTALSIYANRLKQRGGDVIHGAIREVSLVLAGANPGAFIDSIMAHGEYSDEEGIIYSDDSELEFYHAEDDEDDEDEEVEEEETDEEEDEDEEEEDENEYDEESDENDMKHSMEDIFNTLTGEQQDMVYELVGQAVQNNTYELLHAEDDEEPEEVEDDEVDEDETVGDVLKTLSKKQKTVLYALIGKAIEDASGKAEHADYDDAYLMHAEEGEETVADVFNTFTPKQKTVAYALIGKAIEDAKNGDYDEEDDESEEGEETMKHNLFDVEMQDGYDTLSHSEMEAIFSDAQRTGSLREAALAHGVENVEYLFPDAQNVTATPEFIRNKNDWVNVVMNGVRHTPFARIKSLFADITEAEARAKGYVKGNKKFEEIVTALKRTTLPTTIYKKQKLDRDDIIDITGFDVVAWLKGEMRGMLDEEIARAILIGDGRSTVAEDKINESCVRPIWTDDDLFTIKKTVNVATTATDDQKAHAFIRAAVKARKEYKGSGTNLVCFLSEDMLTNCLLMEDTIGHVIYDTEEKLATALRVKKLVPVPCFENASRTVDSKLNYLMGLIVDLGDYNVGADKGGAVNMFDDFDIDYNAQKYLIETRCSGALVKPYSAIILELAYAMTLVTNPEAATTNLLGKLCSELQSDVIVNDTYISGTLKYVTGYTGFSGDVTEQSGNYLALKFDVTSGATTTVELINGIHSAVTLDPDNNIVIRVTNKNTQKVKVVSTNGTESVTKIYSLKSLICLTA